MESTVTLNGSVPSRNSLSRKDRKTLFLTSLGGALEYFDFIVVIFFTSLLVKVFFPPDTPTWLAELQVFGIFAAGYLVRPIGGVFFAHFGDKIGRKKMFALSLFLMAAPTLLIGLLPSYATIGLAAPLLFLLCRILQGMSVGGEVPGAWIFCAEHVRKDRAGFACGVLMAGLCTGMLLGSLSAKLLFTYLNAESLQEWGWRLPFIVGGVFGLVSVYLRRYLSETPVFESMRERRQMNAQIPLKTVLAHHKKGLFFSAALTLVYSGIFVVYFLYIPNFVQSNFGVSPLDAFTYNSWSTVCLIFGAIFIGALADRIGVSKAYVIGCVSMVIVIVAFFVALMGRSGLEWWIYVIGGFFMASISLGQFMIIQCFPPAVRFTGFALAYNTAYAIFGGTAPAFLSVFVAQQILLAPAIYILVLSIFGVCLGFTWKKTGFRL